MLKYTIEELLIDAGRQCVDANRKVFNEAKSYEDAHNRISEELWTALEDHLQARAEAINAGQEVSDIPEQFLSAMMDNPALKSAYLELAPVVEQAVAGSLPVADELPEELLQAIHARALKVESKKAPTDDPVDSALAYIKNAMGAIVDLPNTLVAQVQSLGEEGWKTLRLHGLNTIQRETLMGRSCEALPPAYQGVVDGRYLVAMTLDGDPSLDAAALNLQCQELRPGELSPKAVNTFCLVDENGDRHYAQDNTVLVNKLSVGRHIFQLRIGREKHGAIVLDINE